MDRAERYAILPLGSRPRNPRASRAPAGAVAAADIDGDGADEIAFHTSELLAGAMVYWTGLRFIEIRQLSALPYGLSISEDPALMLLGHLQAGTNRIGIAALEPLQRGEPEPLVRATPCDALAADQELNHFAAINLDGELVVWGRDGAEVARFKEGVGSAFALAELEGDGLPELIASSSSLPGQPDRLRIYGLEGGETQLLYDSGDLQGAVRAVTAGVLGSPARTSVIVALQTQDRPRTSLLELAW
jgi:hypothetical protein